MAPTLKTKDRATQVTDVPKAARTTSPLHSVAIIGDLLTMKSTLKIHNALYGVCTAHKINVTDENETCDDELDSKHPAQRSETVNDGSLDKCDARILATIEGVGCFRFELYEARVVDGDPSANEQQTGHEALGNATMPYARTVTDNKLETNALLTSDVEYVYVKMPSALKDAQRVEMQRSDIGDKEQITRARPGRRGADQSTDVRRCQSRYHWKDAVKVQQRNDRSNAMKKSL